MIMGDLNVEELCSRDDDEIDFTKYSSLHNVTAHFVATLLFHDACGSFLKLRSIYVKKCDLHQHCTKCLDLQKRFVVKPWRFPRLTAIYFPGSVTPWKFQQEFQSRLILENQTTLSRLLQHNRNKLKTAVVTFLSIRCAYKFIDVNVVKMICNLFFTSSPLSWGYTYSEFDYSRKKKIKP